MGELALTFKFEGGDPEQNQLNFYDASRFLYGAARFVYTLEHFRQTGRVLSRITERINVDFRVPTPTPGSWVQDIILVSAPIIAEASIKAPISILVAHVFQRLSGLMGGKKHALELARQLTAQERERTAQERERSAQESEITTQQAISIIDRLVRERRGDDQQRLRLAQAQAELASALAREQALSAYIGELRSITDEQEARLLAQTQPQLAEIGKPLIRSATNLYISNGSIGEPFAFLNRRSVEALSGNVEDPIPTLLVGSITRYDKETGWGKLRNKEFSKPISFVVPSVKKNQINLEVIEAMKEKQVEVSAYRVRDRRGVVRYLVLDKIIEEQEA